MMDNVQPLLDDQNKLKESTLKIAGKRYFCPCGCNVFHNPDKENLDLFQCNGCHMAFETK